MTSCGTIGYFDGTHYDFLSNFHPSRLRWRDPWGHWHIAETVEAIYQAEKCTNRMHYQRIIRTHKPGMAKSLGRRCPHIRSDWDTVKFEIMDRAVLKKFSNHTVLRAQLLNTGDAMLVEGNHWHDNIWGDCLCEKCADIEGANCLGECLMKVRSQLRAQT